MHPRAEEFAERATEEHGVEVAVEEFPEGTKTAADAAAALDCDVGQIASSIVFAVDGGIPATMVTDRGDERDPGIVVMVTSGADEVVEEKLAEVLGVDASAVRTADPDEIRGTVGWSIGGVPPFCHDADVPVYMDRALLGHETVWAAAGTPEAVFPIEPGRLRGVAGARVVDAFE